MDVKQNAKRKTYRKDFKLRAVKMRLEKGFSPGRILQELGIPDESMLKGWIRQYQESGETGLEERRGKLSAGRPSKRPKTEPEELLKRIRRLEMENAVLKNCWSSMGGMAADVKVSRCAGAVTFIFGSDTLRIPQLFPIGVLQVA